MARFRRIVHPTDFSSASRPAFKKAVELARSNRAQLFVVHVLPPVPVVGEGYVTAQLYDDLLRGQRDVGQRELRRLVGRARTAGVRATGVLVDNGITHDRINRVTKSKRGDLIAMGTHGRTGLTRAFLGSVAARVIATASCPVLTVRARGR